MNSPKKGGGAATIAEVQHQHRAHHIQKLPRQRQGSLYSLTLSEVETHLGEPLLSMNLDDLIRSVLPTDKNPPLPSPNASDLQRQGSNSSIAMPAALSKKTVDEVWRDMNMIIQHDRESSDDDMNKNSDCDLQPALGEITLEGFLHRAGVITATGSQHHHHRHQKEDTEDDDELAEADEGAAGADLNLMAGAIDASYSRVQPLGIVIPSAMDGIYPDGQMSISQSMALSDLQSPDHKRMFVEDVVCKVVDRRQKRMIKNRESAARSRARKQAYTNELENKLSHLEEENKKLKREKELDRLLNSASPPEPKKQLERTRSTPF